MKRLVSVLLGYLLLMFAVYSASEEPKEEVVEEVETKAGFNKFIEDIDVSDEVAENAKRTMSKLEIINNQEESTNDATSQSDIDLLATIVRAEAGNQPLEGKRAVADVILNRVDNEQFPDTIEGVIYQEGQFACVNDGNFAKAMYTKDETDYEAVRLELSDRTDSEILFFQTNSYSSYGTPAYVIGDHYFAKR